MVHGRVLIVDDNIENLEVLSVYLRIMGFESKNVQSVEDVYVQVDSFKPDAILLDVRLGKVSGLDVCKKLKSSPKTANISVMLMTGFSDEQMIDEAVSAGADDLLFKPFAMPMMVMRVKNLVKLTQLKAEVNKLTAS